MMTTEEWNDKPTGSNDGRDCTCHPDDRPTGPCPKRFAASECQITALRAQVEALTAERDTAIEGWSASQDKHITALDKIEVLQSTIEQLHGPLSVATLEARAEAEVATLRAELDAARGRNAGDDAEAAFDDDAVYQFSRMMRDKMARSREKGRSGWNDPAKCSSDYLRSLLYEHIYKGDPVDVANICMMLRHYDEPTTPRPEDDLRLPLAALEPDPAVDRMREALVEHNDLLRSTFAIAEREGVKGMVASTNWDAFYNKVAVLLKRHHALANEARAALQEE